MKNKLLAAIIVASLMGLNSVLAQTGSYVISEVSGPESEMLGSGKVLISDQWISFILYTSESFIGTSGGTWKGDGEEKEFIYEYNSLNAEIVGEKLPLKISSTDDNLSITLEGTIFQLKRSSTEPNEMNGVWRISDRERNGEMRPMTWGARKTLKFLIDDTFQWVAFNSETGAFSGTGGGKFTAENGKYVEIIEFFSRDQSRVGAELSFDYEISGDAWTHSGLSSKGDPIKEIWKKVDSQ